MVVRQHVMTWLFDAVHAISVHAGLDSSMTSMCLVRHAEMNRSLAEFNDEVNLTAA